MLIEIPDQELADLLQCTLGQLTTRVRHCGRNVTLHRLRAAGVERRSIADPRKRVRLFEGHWQVKYLPAGEWHPHPGLDEPK